MLIFKDITINDRLLLEPFFNAVPSKQLAYSFNIPFIYRNVGRVQYAIHDNNVVIKYDSGTISRFFFPIGNGNMIATIKEMCAWTQAAQIPFIIEKVTNEQVSFLQQHFPKHFKCEPQRDNYEYIYSADTFRYYKGKALQSKRNFVNFATKNFNWSYQTVDNIDLQECLEFVQLFDGEGSFEIDNMAFQEAIHHFEQLNISGGMIRIDGKLEAVIFCCPLSESSCAAGLFLRGNHSLKGIIPLLYQQYFLEHSEFDSFNLDEDLGVEGLRNNKLSFQPDYLLEVSTVTINCCQQ